MTSFPVGHALNAPLRTETWDQVVAGYRAGVDARIHGATPAPYRALDLVKTAKTANRDDAFAAEDTALTDLVMGDDLRASLYSFDLVQRRAKKPVGVPDKELARPVTKVGIVGAGLMASQLAMLFARRLQVPVVMTDLDQERVDAGVERVHADIDALAAKGRLSADKASRLKGLVSGSSDVAAPVPNSFSKPSSKTCPSRRRYSPRSRTSSLRPAFWQRIRPLCP